MPDVHRFQMKINTAEAPVFSTWMWHRPYVAVRQIRQGLAQLAEALGEEAFDKLISQVSTRQGAEDFARALTSGWALPAAPGWPYPRQGSMPMEGAAAAPTPKVGVRPAPVAAPNPAPAPAPAPAKAEVAEPAAELPTATAEPAVAVESPRAEGGAASPEGGTAPVAQEPPRTEQVPAAAEGREGQAATEQPKPAKSDRSLQMLKEVGLRALSEQKKKTASALLGNESIFKGPTNG